MDEESGSFCSSIFFDVQTVWNTTSPDLSPCFQKTVLLWTPCFCLILVSPVRLYQLSRRHSPTIPFTILNVLKMVFALLIAILTIVDVGKSLQEHMSSEVVPTVDFVSPLVLCLAMVTAVLIIFNERKYGVKSSGCMCLFWMALLIVETISYQSRIRRAIDKGKVDDMFRFVTFCITYALVLVEFILTLFVDRHIDTYEAPKDRERKPCPEQNAPFLSRITFWWHTRLIIMGHRKALEHKDLFDLNPDEKCINNVANFEKHWQKEKRRTHRNPEQNDNGIEMKTVQNNGHVYTDVRRGSRKVLKARLYVCLFKTYWPLMLLTGVYRIITSMGLQFTGPLILKKMIQFTQNDEYVWRGYMYAVAIFVLNTLKSIINQQFIHTILLTIMRCRASIICTVYRKMLTLTNSARRSSTVGEMVNLMAVDAQRVTDFVHQFHLLWSAPIEISIALYLLWQILGIATLAGVGLFLLILPINIVLARKTKVLQAEIMSLKDSRIKLMNEILNGIKVLKLYAWEKSYQEEVLKIRKQELRVLRTKTFLNAVMSFTWTISPFLMNLFAFMAYVLSDPSHVLDAEKIFVSLSLYNIMKHPLANLPQVITNMIPMAVSMKRLHKFLNNEELDPDLIIRNTDSKHTISITKGTFAWEKDGDPILRNIELNIEKGSLVAVVGTVGAGKSSLLSAILGEMDKVGGKVCLQGSVAYVAQQAWIQNSTLQNNVLFGSTLNQKKYDKVINACALRPDLEILPGGDQTEIGEKGINLSGGQKQRVSLARAVYQDADVYLLDDPLSAVDSHVGKHIFEQIVGANGLLKDKTRILVTHGISFLPKVDKIIVLVDGRISEVGSYHDLISHAGAFAEFLKNYMTEESEHERNPDNDLEQNEDLKMAESVVSQLGLHIDEKQNNKLENKLARRVGSQNGSAFGSQMSRIADHAAVLSNWSLDQSIPNTPVSPMSTPWIDPETISHTSSILHFTENHKVEKLTDENMKASDKKDDIKLIKEEKMEIGRVKWGVYASYLKSCSLHLAGFLALFILLRNVLLMLTNMWLSRWSSDVDSLNGNMTSSQRDMRLGVYATLGILQAFCALVGEIFKACAAVKAARKLHQLLLENILRSPMSFFDTTPTGRIVNRFSKDVDAIDMSVPDQFRHTLYLTLEVLTTIVVISISTPLFLSVIIPLGLFYFVVQKFYVATSRQLRRLESTNRSPIYSHFGETISGVSTIRAYRKEERFIKDSEKRVDNFLICFFPMTVSFRWLAIRLEFLANCIVVFFAVLFAVISRDSISAGLVGLSITYALDVTQLLNWLVRIFAELETNVVSVERVKEYSETPREAEWDIEDTRPGSKWPDEGIVEFANYGTRYREGLDLVIKGLTCKIVPGEKVGIVGRTGAGKSSLAMGLFRIIEKAQGSIIIDGVDISTLGLHDLRSKLTIIPQEPVLFSGSLRMNLDPFSVKTDDQLWEAMEHAHLKSFVSGLPAGLQHECAEGGANLSVGQRQLICLARALLRKTKILILDEATAAVDLEMDDLIQNTIRTEFADCTILTIAHRLNTIMDYTRIMVLDAGKIKEFDSPKALLADQSTVFYSMAKDAGLVY